MESTLLKAITAFRTLNRDQADSVHEILKVLRENDSSPANSNSREMWEYLLRSDGSVLVKAIEITKGASA